MIDFISGRLIKKSPHNIIVDVAGVGYGLEIPLSTFEKLPGEGEEVGLYALLHLTEKELNLYGFFTEEEKEIFKVIRNISGIGPKTALAILSCLGIEEFARAVTDQNVNLITSVPGIGKKTAERLIVELKDRIKRFILIEAKPGEKLSTLQRGKIEDAISALIALGCKPGIASRAVNKALQIKGPEASLEELIREGLKHRT